MKWSAIAVGMIAVLMSETAFAASPKTAPPTKAPTLPPTKDIQLNTNIMPAWGNLGTRAWTRKIKLNRVYKYWATLEKRDKNAIKSLYSSSKEQNKALDKVDDFYDGAKKCLRKQDENKKKNRTQVDQALKEIAKCIQGTVTPPTFTVLASQSLPKNYEEVEKPDIGDDDDDDNDDDDDVKTPATTSVIPVVKTPPPVTTTAPLVTTTPKVTTAAPQVTTAAPTATPTAEAPPYAPQSTLPQPGPSNGENKSDDKTPGPTSNESPSTSTDSTSKPAVTANEPTNSNDNPTMINGDKPTTTSNGEPTVPGTEPTMTKGDEPMTSNDMPSASNGEPTMPGTEPTMTKGDEPMTSSDMPSTSNGEPAMPGTEPTNSNDVPKLPATEPATTVDEPTVSPNRIKDEPIGPIEPLPAPLQTLTTDFVDPVWPFDPASPEVPPLWALDWDHSNALDDNEWIAYVKRLHGLATKAAMAGRDPVAVNLLQQIIDFHYASLGHCISKKLHADGIIELQESEYDQIAKWIQANCYVKFRYSLFAGVPPFEWIAKDQATVPATMIEAWFKRKVETAQSDLQVKHVVSVSPEHQELVEKFVGCAIATLQAAGDATVDRNAYYGALHEIEACAQQ